MLGDLQVQGDLQVHYEIPSELYYTSALRVGISEMADLWGVG